MPPRASYRGSPLRGRQGEITEIDTGLKADVHGILDFDPESQQWLTHKGNKARKTLPEIRFTTSSKPWELAVEFNHLNKKILELDIEHFGETIEGETDKASVKR